MKMYLLMSSAAVVIGALRVNYQVYQVSVPSEYTLRMFTKWKVDNSEKEFIKVRPLLSDVSAFSKLTGYAFK